MAEPYLNRPYGVLTDFRKADLSLISADDINKIYFVLKSNKAQITPFHLAVLASGPLEYGLNRMFEMQSDDTELQFKVHVTYDPKKAWHWAKNSPKP